MREPETRHTDSYSDFLRLVGVIECFNFIKSCLGFPEATAKQPRVSQKHSATKSLLRQIKSVTNLGKLSIYLSTLGYSILNCENGSFTVSKKAKQNKETQQRHSSFLFFLKMEAEEEGKV